MRIISLVLLSLAVILPPTYLMAQETPPAAPHDHYAERFLKDQKSLWAAPARIKRSDIKWLVPLAAGAGILMANDWKLSESARRAEGIHPASRVLSKFGGAGPMAAASGAMWGLGALTHDSRAASTGPMASEAVLHASLAALGLKLAFNRERPNKFDGQGQFWGGGRSFPSGHAATTFAFATVVAHQYKDKPWVRIGAYGLATAVSFSRVGGLKHYPSDVMIGAAVGHLVGRFVLHRRQ